MPQLKHKPRAWTPVARTIVLKPTATALADVSPLLARVVEALVPMPPPGCWGQIAPKFRAGGRGRKRSAVKWGAASWTCTMSSQRILRVYDREAAALWLVGSEPLLGGARPIDVLVMEGAGSVVRAIDGIAQGAYA